MEIAVRMALGAERKEVLWMVLRESMLMTAIGLLISFPLALGTGHLLRSMLYGLSAGDPLALFLSFAGIAVVTLAASLLPARRAASLDPMRALRVE